MKINTDNIKKIEEEKQYLTGGDVVYCDAGDTNACSFYGIYVPSVGVVDSEYCSTACMPYKGKMYLGQSIGYWTITKIYKDAELIIK